MGTRFEMALSGGSSAARSSAELRAAGEAAWTEVTELHAMWSAFDPGSLLTRVNRLAAGRAVPVDGETFSILVLAKDLWEATEGAFDPTLGAQMRARGFRPDSLTDSGGGDDPSPGMAAVELDRDAGTVRFLDRRVELDLGALAKGYALDRVEKSLRESEVPCALIHGGNSGVVAIGTPPDSPGWPIALDRDGILPRAFLRDCSFSVSAGSGRVVDGEDGPQGHVLDPAGGDVGIDRFSAVVTDSAAVADAWATALLVLDRVPEAARDFSIICGRTEGAVPAEVTLRQDPRGVFST